MKKILALIILTFSSVTGFAAENYFEKYPIGTISENLLYDVLNQNRDQLRKCHLDYLKKIPGGFDTLSLEFQIDPQGSATPKKSEFSSPSKEEATKCLGSLIRSFQFPSPIYGIVFARFDSDVDVQNTSSISSQELARSSVTLVPYVPQKLITSTIEMFMPYYKGCFKKPYVEKNKPGKVTIKWTISEDGSSTDVQVSSTISNEKMSTCLTQVTEQHRYPSGYAKTSAETTFNLTKVF